MSPVAHPPTNTTSSSIGSNARAAASSNRRFGSSCIRSFSYALYDLSLREAPLAGATVPQCVQEGQQFVEARVRLRGQGYGRVQRLEGNTSVLTHRERPDRRKIRPRRDVTVQRHRRVRSEHPPGDAAPDCWKHVLCAMHEELLRRARVRSTTPSILEEQPLGHPPVARELSTAPGVLEYRTCGRSQVARGGATALGVFEDQTRSLQPLEGSVNLGPAEEQVRSHSRQGWPTVSVGQQLRQHNNVLGKQGGRTHSDHPYSRIWNIE